MHGAVRVDDEGERFSWSVPGFESPLAVGLARVTLHAPTATEGARCAVGVADAERWSGLAADTHRCEAYSDRGAWHFSAVNLAAGEALNVRLELPPGAIEAPLVAEVILQRIRAHVPSWVLWPLGLFGFLFFSRARLRPPRAGRLEPYVVIPPVLSPAELGAVWEERVDLDDLVASVFNLGARGHLQVQEQTSSLRLFLRAGTSSSPVCTRFRTP